MLDNNRIGQGGATTIVRRPRWPAETRRGHQTRRRQLEMAAGIGIPVALIALWQLASSAEWIDARFYPAPSQVVRDGWELIENGRLRHDVWVSLRRLLAGYLIGATSGYVFGVVMGTVRFLRRAFKPLLSALYTVPKIALLPIFLTIFGLGDGPKVALVTVTVFFFVWLPTMEATATVGVGFLESAESLGLSQLGVFRHVIVPASLPQVFVALRLSMGAAVLVTVASEFLVGNDGIGYLIFNSRNLLQMGWSFVGIAVASIGGVLLTAIVELIGRRITPWAKSGS